MKNIRVLWCLALILILLCGVVLTACADDKVAAESVASEEVAEEGFLDRITGGIKNFFLETVGEEWCVFFCSMIPIIELRGAIPMGFAFGLPMWLSYLLSVIGNMLPVPFILLFIRAILNWMKKVPKLDKIALWLEARAAKKSDKVNKYATLGLLVFVALPLPGTGAWTGSLVAALMEMRLKHSLLSVFCGVLIAGVIVTLIAYGALGFLKFLL